MTRFLKGVFELKPSLPRYTSIWDVGTVLQYLTTLHPIAELDIKILTKKLTLLLCLLTGQRCQTLTKLDISLMQELPDKYVFTIGEKLKTTKPGRHLEPIELVAYKQDESLCVVSHIKRYLYITKELRGHNCQLLISFIKPHNPISNSTIGKWVKSILAMRALMSRNSPEIALDPQRLPMERKLVLLSKKYLRPAAGLMRKHWYLL